ncbi:helix-turn-helix domain-containing protein [Microlunatus sp. GCM10028923]|uniref:GbsR/MarR family transcriptional regulator n=1 Tax=Microlunatus sp. GCM10028923 TaxID=3273400 RepID=UPI0036187BC5
MTVSANATAIGCVAIREDKMPGERLAYEDRRTISEGLAEGLSYAEIARRIRRPRSTVGREITRNGGPRNYRAHRAQQATTVRARRRPSSTAKPAPANHYPRDATAVRELEEQLGTTLGQSGLPPMIARVMVALMTSDDQGLTVADLTARLHVSPASISKAIAWLEPLQLVHRERDQRRDRYLIDGELWYRAWLVGTRSIGRYAEVTAKGVKVLGEDTPAGAQLQRAAIFFDLLGRDMAQAAEHYRNVLTGPDDDLAQPVSKRER